MLLSGVETVALLPAPPNPFLAFCFFNLIMALIFMSSSAGAKPSGSVPDNHGGLGGQMCSPEGVETTEEVTDGAEKPDDDGDGGVDVGVGRVVHDVPSRTEESRDVCPTGDEVASDGGDCEELNRRVEEFIVKMNRAWVAERQAFLPTTVVVGGELRRDSVQQYEEE